MSFNLIYVPFHVLALLVLIAGEVRAYRSRKRIWRLIGLPLAFLLIPYFTTIGRLMPPVLAHFFFHACMARCRTYMGHTADGETSHG